MKPIWKVFIVIGTLAAALLIWALFFNKNGVLQTAWNGLISPVNKTWGAVTGDKSAELLPEWGSGGAGVQEGTESLDGNGGL